jgi:hypothetical protein
LPSLATSPVWDTTLPGWQVGEGVSPTLDVCVILTIAPRTGNPYRTVLCNILDAAMMFLVTKAAQVTRRTLPSNALGGLVASQQSV